MTMVGFGWVQPPVYSRRNSSGGGRARVLHQPTWITYTARVRSHPSQLTIGALWKGFDDNNASWGKNRVIAQQCGQVLLNTAKEISKYFGGSNPQIPYVQVVTWNDYEEGTAVEDGIDNCYTVNASLSGRSSHGPWPRLILTRRLDGPSLQRLFRGCWPESLRLRVEPARDHERCGSLLARACRYMDCLCRDGWPTADYQSDVERRDLHSLKTPHWGTHFFLNWEKWVTLAHASARACVSCAVLILLEDAMILDALHKIINHREALSRGEAREVMGEVFPAGVRTRRSRHCSWACT